MTESASNAIFLMATYGEGEPTDNSAEFYKWITKDAPPSCLAKLKFAGMNVVCCRVVRRSDFVQRLTSQPTVFALGNTQYEWYNTMGKDVDSKSMKSEQPAPLEASFRSQLNPTFPHILVLSQRPANVWAGKGCSR